MAEQYELADQELTRLASELLAVRRHLHSHPELSGKETATTAYLGEILSREGIPHRIGKGGCGIITEFAPSSMEGAVSVALRGDIDALPILEENDVSYRSQSPGVMHACGHDAHAAMVLGAVIALHRTGPGPVRWRAIFQPSEEAGQGALDMVGQGALEGVDSIIALHVDPTIEAGILGVTPGPQTACCQDFNISIKGRGAHAARPHLAIDPISISANLVTLVHQVVPRQTDSRRPVVVSFGQISAGHCTNVIPDSALLRGTIRSLDASVSVKARETIERICSGLAQIFGAEVIAVFDRAINGVVNDPKLAALCQESARFVTDQVITSGEPSLGAEDFADYLTSVPGCMTRLGVRTPGKKITPLHTPSFDIDESAIALGSRYLVRALLAHAKWNETHVNQNRL